MSYANDNPPQIDRGGAEGREFDLDYIIDVTSEPSEITIFLPTEGTDTTHWITADSDVAIPLDDIR